jgi:hypothetical protein
VNDADADANESDDITDGTVEAPVGADETDDAGAGDAAPAGVAAASGDADVAGDAAEPGAEPAEPAPPGRSRRKTTSARRQP